MRFVRSIVTQYYRRGKSLGADAIKAGISVVESIVPYCVGLGLGTGTAHLIIGNNADMAQRDEELWERQQRRLEKEEAKLEQLLKIHGAKRTQEMDT